MTQEEKNKKFMKLLTDEVTINDTANEILNDMSPQFGNDDLQSAFDQGFIEGFKQAYGMGLQDAADIFD
jgi:hypothetical protein